MKALAACLLFFLAGCASAPSPIAPDYITGFEEPLARWGRVLLNDSYYGALMLVDNTGREVRVYRNSRPGVWDTEELWLGNSEGRRLDYAGEEGAKLLRILEGIPVHNAYKAFLDDYANFIRERRSNPKQEPAPGGATEMSPPAR